MSVSHQTTDHTEVGRGGKKGKQSRGLHCIVSMRRIKFCFFGLGSSFVSGCHPPGPPPSLSSNDGDWRRAEEGETMADWAQIKEISPVIVSCDSEAAQSWPRRLTLWPSRTGSGSKWENQRKRKSSRIKARNSQWFLLHSFRICLIICTIRWRQKKTILTKDKVMLTPVSSPFSL